MAHPGLAQSEPDDDDDATPTNSECGDDEAKSPEDEEEEFGFGEDDLKPIRPEALHHEMRRVFAAFFRRRYAVTLELDLLEVSQPCRVLSASRVDACACRHSVDTARGGEEWVR